MDKVPTDTYLFLCKKWLKNKKEKFISKAKELFKRKQLEKEAIIKDSIKEQI